MTEFERIALAHGARYSLMEPQDYGKLAFQSEFGPEHLVTDERDAAERIAREWQAASDTFVPCNPEPIGNGICRFHMTWERFTMEDAQALAALFLRSAKEHAGTPEGLNRRLDVLRRLPVDGMEAWLEQYRERGCPPVHHSDAYRAAYHPHYRILLAPLARSLDAILAGRQGPRG